MGRRSGRQVPLRPAAGLRLSAQWGGADTRRASAHRACSRRSAGPCVGLSGDSAGRMTVCAAQGGGRLRSAPQTHVNVDRSQPREDRKGGREAWEGGPEAAGVQRPGEKEPQRQQSSETDFEGCGWKGSGGKAQLPRPAPGSPRPAPRSPRPAPRAPHPAPRARAALAASCTREAQGHKPGKANGDHTE